MSKQSKGAARPSEPSAPQTSAEQKCKCCQIPCGSKAWCNYCFVQLNINSKHRCAAAPQPVSRDAPGIEPWPNERLQEYIWNQIDEQGGAGNLLKPYGVSDSRFDRVVNEVIASRKAGDAPKVEEMPLARKAAYALAYADAITVEEMEAILRPYFPPASQTPDRMKLAVSLEDTARCFYGEQYGDTPLEPEMVAFAARFAACQLTGYKTEEEERNAQG